MPTPQHHIQNAIETIVSPAATAIGGAAATGSVAAWATHFRDGLHENAQTAIDLSAYFAALWFVVQIFCKIYVTFFKKRAPDE